jgi:hypothetical protein
VSFVLYLFVYVLFSFSCLFVAVVRFQATALLAIPINSAVSRRAKIRIIVSGVGMSSQYILDYLPRSITQAL